MDHVKVKIEGYRQLSEAEQATINSVKEVAKQVGALVDSLALYKEIDQRWLAIGRTDLQKGFMAVIRSIAKPTTF